MIFMSKPPDFRCFRSGAWDSYRQWLGPATSAFAIITSGLPLGAAIDSFAWQKEPRSHKNSTRATALRTG
jgi:uncharacterized membrane protein YdcZ (DUF606 family)